MSVLSSPTWRLEASYKGWLRDCFVNLPHELIHSLQLDRPSTGGADSGLPFVFKLTHGRQAPVGPSAASVAWVSWSGLPSQGGKLEMGPHMAASLGIADRASVQVRYCGRLPACGRVFVEPESADDWEIIGLQPGRLESEFLSQIRVCFSGQTLPYLLDNTLVHLKVLSSPETTPSSSSVSSSVSSFVSSSALEPSPLVLSADSEVCIAPKPRWQPPDDGQPVATLLCRLQPLSMTPPMGPLTAEFSRGIAFLNPACFARSRWQAGDVVALKPLVSHPEPPFKVKQALESPSSSSPSPTISSSSTTPSPTIEPEVFIAVFPNPTCRPGHLMIDEQLFESLRRLPYERVLAIHQKGRFVKARIDSLTLLPACSRSACLSAQVILNSFVAFASRVSAAQHPAFVIGPRGCFLIFHTVREDDGSGVGIDNAADDPIDSGSVIRCRVLVNATPSGHPSPASHSPKHFYVFHADAGSAQKLPFAVHVSHEAPKFPLLPSLPIPFSPLDMTLAGFGGYGEVLRKAASFINWCHSPPPQGPTQRRLVHPRLSLICGRAGAGKTHLLNAIRSHYLEAASAAFVWRLDAGEWRGKKLSEVVFEISSGFVRARASGGPAVLLFDSLDLLLEPTGPSAESSTHSESALHIAAVLSDLVQSSSGWRIACLASCLQSNHLPPRLSSPSILAHVFELAPPEEGCRRDILCKTFRQQGLPGIAEAVVDELVARSQGYVAADLHQLVTRVLHRAAVRAAGTWEQVLTVGPDDAVGALEECVPSAIKTVKFEKPEGRWEDVGGLFQVKADLEETFLWPSKYPELFSACPLRARSGVLLYGPPGCGKTFLAGALANHSDLRLIAVKGPELLNKYIGASERSVREVFQRAAAASPCLLFFDEFDAVASKRGKDKTGVTDRVVNQLLTELDGVEESRGIYVLGATSRPDLLDPALLRPGRLDKSLYCPLPSERERLDILQRIVAKLPLSPELDRPALCQELAVSTERFTGADLQALFMNAQLFAIHSSPNLGVHSNPSPSNKPSSAPRLTLLAGGAVPDALMDSISVNLYEASERAAPAAGLSQHSRTEICIQRDHVFKALGDTNPSVSIDELRHFERIYDRFQTKSLDPNLLEQRQTLA